MNKSVEKMKWIIFWVFLILFTLAVLGTLAVVFLGFGTPTDGERELLVKGLIGEIAACIVALFYSIFGLKRGGVPDETALADIEKRLAALEALPVKGKESFCEQPDQQDLNIEMNSNSSILPAVVYDFYPELQSIHNYNVEAPFEQAKYTLEPTALAIKSDIRAAKPYDKTHRKDSYIGHRIQWKCAFSVLCKTDDSYDVTLSTDASFYMVYFELKEELAVKLKHLDENHPLWVCGEIQKVSDNSVTLKDVQVSL